MRRGLVELGPFELFDVVGRGGSAVVWRGVHREQGVPVAVKVLKSERTRDEAYLASLRNEVRITAGLDHPHIVRLFEHGEIDEDQAVRSNGALVAGAPYLVVEWASGGTVRGSHLRSWPDLLRTLLTLLDALAHAHARGIVHRDIKPANMMLCTAEDVRPGFKLVDFGIARPVAFEPSRDGEPRAPGTPSFMAPEQAAGDWRELGPWTDLYAVGCFAFLGATGRPPFRATSPADTLLAHAQSPPPRLVPIFGVPDGLDAWVATLLEKRPEHRFQRAADAAAALLALGAASTDGPADPCAPTAHEDPTSTMTVLVAGLAQTQLDTLPPFAWPNARPAQAPTPRPEHVQRAVAIASDWRANDPPRVPMKLAGVGLALYGLRGLPVVGRVEERDVVWGCLREVASTGTAHALTLAGARGVGKSRMADWLAQRAHELGAATVVRVIHGPIAGPAHGVAAALARHLRLDGLAPADVRARIERRVLLPALANGADRDAFVLLVSRSSSADLDPGATVSERAGITVAERHALLRRIIEDLAAVAPVVVTVDDGLFAGETLAFVRDALGAWQIDPCPVLFAIAGAAPEPLAGARTVTLAPLADADHARLVREVLGLDDALARSVEARTAGNPLFAVQLVRDWMDRGLLEPTESGFRWRAGVAPETPAELLDVWRRRAERALGRASQVESIGVELGAALGHHVDGAEWRDACRHAGVEAPAALLESLLRDNLVRSDDRNLGAAWEFVHEMFREAVEQRARAAGRWPSLQRACADMLATRLGPEAAVRRGWHRVAAGEPEGALEDFRVAAHAYSGLGDIAPTHRALDAYETALATAQLAENDERHAEASLQRASVLAREGRFDAVEPIVVRVEREARARGWARALARVLARRVHLLRNRSAFEEAELVGAEAVAVAESTGDRTLRGLVLQNVADVAWRGGQLERAIELYRAAIADYDAVGEPVHSAGLLLSLGGSLGALGRIDEAIAVVERGREELRACGSRWGVARALNVLGDLWRKLGDLARAETAYREALSGFEALGHHEARFTEVNLAFIAIEGGHVKVARGWLGACRRNLQTRGGEAVLEAAIETALVACEALDANWECFDATLARANALLEKHAFADPDIALLYRVAGDAAADRKETARAVAAYARAEHEWRRVGRVAEAEAAAQLARRLAG